MLGELKQFVPSAVCLACEGCCRFADPGSLWRPRLGEGEEVPAIFRSACSQKQVVDTCGYLFTAERAGQNYCVCLNPDDNACQAYLTRPFECQLYPFLLLREENAVWLAVHLNCPFVQETRMDARFESYRAVLKEFFRQPSAQKFLEDNKSAFPDYQDSRAEIELLFPF